MSPGTGEPADPGKLADAASKPAPIFTDVTAEAGLPVASATPPDDPPDYRLATAYRGGGAIIDFDDDGWMDVLLPEGGCSADADAEQRAPPSRLFRNLGDGTFSEMKAAIVSGVTRSMMGFAVSDMDNDGDSDLFVTKVGRCALLRNENGQRFADVTESSGIDSIGLHTAAAFFDYDRDGRMDLVIVRYTQDSPTDERPCYDSFGRRDFCTAEAYQPGTTQLYHNMGNGRFENVGVSSGIAAVPVRGTSVVCGDFDRDGWSDVFVAGDRTPSQLWTNRGNGTFDNRGTLIGASADIDGFPPSVHGAAAADIDTDGDLDLLMTCDRAHGLLCLRNDGRFFEDISYSMGFGNQIPRDDGSGIAVFDQDNDGRLDLLVANGATRRLNETGHFGRPYAENIRLVRLTDAGNWSDDSAAIGQTAAIASVWRSVLPFDYDNDGDLDLLITRRDGEAVLLRNESPTNNHWVIFDLRPASDGRNALGARLDIYSAGAVHRRDCRAQEGCLGSRDPRVHVGLGSADKIDRLTVTWPNGQVERWEALPANHLIELRAGTAPAWRDIEDPPSGGSAQ